MTRHTVTVKVGEGYPVEIGGGLLGQCGELIRGVVGGCRAAVVTDSNVAQLYLEQVLDSLADAGIGAESYVIDAGENSKNLGVLGGILEFLAQRQFTRSDVVVALGGGVTGDIAGFAAAVYLRGVRCVQLPTTLLAAVDSSVGGKTAVNLAEGKNLVGAFSQPSLVVCDTTTFETLPPEEFAGGMAEAVKYGVLFSRELFELFRGEFAASELCQVVERCVSYKAEVVAHDEHDRGERRLLNLGHTIGHAIERCSGYTVRHGYAVAAGMAMIARAGEAMGLTERGTAADICSVLERWSLPTRTDYPADALMRAALGDKKRLADEIAIVLPVRIGECKIVTEPVGRLADYISLGKEG